jgi:diguanylate cyclase (GGDEF)-like protein
MWSGCRQFNDRPSLLWVSFAASAVVGMSALFEGSDGGAWAGGAAMFVLIAAFAALASTECVRDQLRASRNARPLAGVFMLLSAYYSVRTGVFLIDGASGDMFLNYLGTETTTFFTIGLVMMAAISMSVLMESRYPHRAGLAVDGTSAIPGVLNRAQFDEHATLWLARARRERDSLVVVFLDIANLDDINSAFGRAYGDQAILAVARTISEHVPSAAVVGCEGGMHFAVLTTAPAIGNTTVVAQNLHTALVETPIDAEEEIRAVAICSVATTDRYGYDLVTLRTAAADALAEATRVGPGTITLAR